MPEKLRPTWSVGDCPDTEAGMGDREAIRVLPAVTSVWSAYGHRFTGTGDCDSEGNPYDDCLTCGAKYLLVRDPENLTSGTYQANDGSQPMYCSGNPGMVHGYDRECEFYNGSSKRLDGHREENCPHCEHTCNCLQCD